MNNWKKVWNKRKLPVPECKELNEEINREDENFLSELIKINGFDGGSGKSDIAAVIWKVYRDLIKKCLNIQDDDSLFEVGCGCGAMLYPFYNAGHTVGGIDYSSKLIQYAISILPKAELICGDAFEINDIKYDFVISNSVFHYFSDYDYSSIVIKKMYEKANKGIAVLDIPDLYLKEQCENKRRYQVPDYHNKYKNLSHLYYPKGFFLDFAEKCGCSTLTLTRQNLLGYGYNNYRFNCFIVR